MKKLACVTLVLIMLLALAACGPSGSTNTPPSSDSPEASSSGGATIGDISAGDHNFDITKVDTSDWVKMDLSYAGYLPAENPIANLMYTKTVEKIEELMPGWINITLFPSETLLSQADIYEGVISGVTDIGFVDVSIVAELMPVTALWCDPSVTITATSSATAALQEWLQMVELEELSDVVVLQGQTSTWNQMVTNFQWTTVDELSGKQICVTAAFTDLVSALGAVPASISTAELYEAARSGLIDGAYYAITANYLAGAHEFLKYGTVTTLGASPFLICMNKDTFNTMPKTQQDFFLEACRQAMWEEIIPDFPAVADFHEESLRAVESGDYIYYDLPEETIEDMRSRVGHLREEYLARYEGQYTNIREASDLIDELTAKWNEWYPAERYTLPFEMAMDGITAIGFIVLTAVLIVKAIIYIMAVRKGVTADFNEIGRIEEEF